MPIEEHFYSPTLFFFYYYYEQKNGLFQSLGSGNMSNQSGGLNSGLSMSGPSAASNAGQGSYGRSTSDGYNPNAPVTYPTNYGSSAR